MKRCSIATLAATPEFRYVAEQDSFLALFPHRFDFIYAEHPEPGQSPSWETERRYPLSDRMVQQGGNLYGVRFGSRTQYCLLDIDTGSFYHPQRDPLAIGRIMTALESIGLVSYLACTSSYSSGIHLYLPFTQSQSSWELAIGLATLLENSGFKLKPGHLEFFPNPKPYSVQGKPTLFNAHRLPLQIGSYLLDSDFQPIWSDRSRFVDQWQLVQSQNDLNKATLKQILKQAKRKQYRVSGRADKFLNDLNAEIEQGWTDAIRKLYPDEVIYTFFDYFRNAYERNAGLRIDHFLLSPQLEKRLKAGAVDRNVRGWEKSSDHCPVWIELADE